MIQMLHREVIETDWLVFRTSTVLHCNYDILVDIVSVEILIERFMLGFFLSGGSETLYLLSVDSSKFIWCLCSIQVVQVAFQN